jgi:hypothetical protein
MKNRAAGTFALITGKKALFDGNFPACVTDPPASQCARVGTEITIIHYHLAHTIVDRAAIGRAIVGCETAPGNTARGI